ncbi:hypothetical protein FB45DRAFT_885727 [Roridomyces roridus]|uniref:L domain-like protein n=1 Tax=Roridomyces roridus TaxID=1738132 RepID=A0AAD7CI11_9AGAR|nr:hypothetical protein FB45DRAFT_885727 [Roridomyces roridus]
MSRIPQPSRGTPRKAPASLKPPEASESPRARTKSTVGRSTTPVKSPKKPFADDFDKPAVPALSIKELLALKRAEAKKAQKKSSSLDDFSSLEDAVPDSPAPEAEDILGRPPLREAIERAKSTGSLNLSTRSLQCIPSALFDLHLGITPEPLKSVPEEPPLPPAPEKRQQRASPAWYETQDLEILKAWGNEIKEIQPEISLFGSLKSIDLHKNQIVSLPDQFADLAALTTLDLSHNALTSLPANLFSLPALSNLNVAHNALTSLPFSAPFSSAKAKAKSAARGLFGSDIQRASAPLPKLVIFDASHNKLTAGAIDLSIPESLVNLDLSENPLDLDGHEPCAKLFGALAALRKLKVLRCDKAAVSDRIFEGNNLSSSAFPSISVFDFGSTKVTESGASFALKDLGKPLDFEITNEDPPVGIIRVIVGKKIVREAWEVEAERRSKSRTGKVVDGGERDDLGSGSGKPAAAAAPSPQKPASQIRPVKPPVMKESWEIEAEQGLLTEGGKRRARAAAAAAASANDDSASSLPSQSSSPKVPSLTDPQYYAARTETLTLPASTAPKALGHSRAFSVHSTSLKSALAPRVTDVTLPTATMPLAVISAQPFAHTLKVLILANRRMDRSFTLPTTPIGQPLLPRLEELSLEGCNLGDLIAVSTASPEETIVPTPTETKPILPLLADLFPSLRSLNLAYNTLTSASFSTSIVSSLILSDDASPGPARKGLKQLHLRGNRITDLDGFQGVAILFKGNREVPGWGLEELDIRDNEIGKLNPELGLLPLDVFLVDGNVFRVPQRKVWEREGTKGLLSWLRGRIE